MRITYWQSLTNMWKEYWDKDNWLERMIRRYKTIGYYRFIRYMPKQIGTSLEVGCGNAQISKILTEMGWHTTGLDLNTPKECYVHKFVEGNALSLPFQNKQFDLVFSCGVVEHFSPDDQILHMKEMLRVGKRVVCFFPTCDWKWKLLWKLRGVPDGNIYIDYTNKIDFLGFKYGYICI